MTCIGENICVTQHTERPGSFKGPARAGTPVGAAVGTGVDRRKTETYVAAESDWWRSAVIYQIYPRSFADSNGDGVGDLRGILAQLDYVESLNVDAVWISPFYRSPMKDFGYDVSDFCAVDPLFGTLEDFQAILDACRERGLRVIIDQVWNHTSDQHPWFLESRASRDNPRADWYVWADAKEDGTPPNNWLSTFGGSAWTWAPERRQYYLHNFLTEQPDLNWYNEDVIEAVLATARFWLELGVDGFRLDVINFLLHDRHLRDNPQRGADQPRPAGAAADDPFFDQLNLHNLCQPETIALLPRIRALMEEYGAATLAEISSAENTLLASVDYVEGADRLHSAYNSSLMSDEPLTARRINGLIDTVGTLFSEGVICWTAGTHDFPRVKSRWTHHQPPEPFLHDAFDHMFAALLLSLRGCCCIYQGDELGLAQAEIPHELMQDPFGIKGYPRVLGRDGSRTPMPWRHDLANCGFTDAEKPWLPLAPEHRERAVDLQQKDSGSLLNRYRRLLQWRRAQPALRQGQLRHLQLVPGSVAFVRESGEQRLLCVFNPGTVPLYLVTEDMGIGALHLMEDFPLRRYGSTIELPSFGVLFAELAT